MCKILRGFLGIYNHLHWSRSFKSFINSLINRMDLEKSMENRSVNSMHCGIGMLKNERFISTSEINLKKNNYFLKIESPVHISSPYTHKNFTEITVNEPTPSYDAYDHLNHLNHISTSALSNPTEFIRDNPIVWSLRWRLLAQLFENIVQIIQVLHHKPFFIPFHFLWNASIPLNGHAMSCSFFRWKYLLWKLSDNHTIRKKISAVIYETIKN